MPTLYLFNRNTREIMRIVENVIDYNEDSITLLDGGMSGFESEIGFADNPEVVTDLRAAAVFTDVMNWINNILEVAVRLRTLYWAQLTTTQQSAWVAYTQALTDYINSADASAVFPTPPALPAGLRFLLKLAQFD